MSKPSSSSRKVHVRREAQSGRFVAEPSAADLINFFEANGLNSLSGAIKDAQSFSFPAKK